MISKEKALESALCHHDSPEHRLMACWQCKTGYGNRKPEAKCRSALVFGGTFITPEGEMPICFECNKVEEKRREMAEQERYGKK